MIEDRIEGELVPLTFVLPLAPGLEPELGAISANRDRDGTGASDRSELSLRLRDRRRLTIELPSGVNWAIERSSYFPRFGEHVERACLVGKADGFKAGTWRFSVSDEGGHRR